MIRPPIHQDHLSLLRTMFHRSVSSICLVKLLLVSRFILKLTSGLFTSDPPVSPVRLTPTPSLIRHTCVSLSPLCLIVSPPFRIEGTVTNMWSECQRLKFTKVELHVKPCCNLLLQRKHMFYSPPRSHRLKVNQEAKVCRCHIPVGVTVP